MQFLTSDNYRFSDKFHCTDNNGFLATTYSIERFSQRSCSRLDAFEQLQPTAVQP